jgi:hypothetical protein
VEQARDQLAKAVEQMPGEDAPAPDARTAKQLRSALGVISAKAGELKRAMGVGTAESGRTK